MSFIIRNITSPSANAELDDLGLTIPAAAELDLTSEPPQTIATSSDLTAAINAGDLIVLDPLDGVTELSVADSLSAVGTYNDPQFRPDLFERVIVSGQSDIVADSSTDSLTFVAGLNMTITTNAAADTITFTSSGGGGGTALCIDFILSDLTPTQVRLIDIALIFTKTGGIQNLIPTIGSPLKLPFKETDGTVNNIAAVNCI